MDLTDNGPRMPENSGRPRRRPGGSRSAGKFTALCLTLLAFTSAPDRHPAQAAPPEPARRADARLNSQPARVSFGMVDALDTPTIVRDFVLTNPGARDLTVESLEPSCRCTRAAIHPGRTPGGADAPLPLVLGPGQSATVHVVVNLTVLQPGPLAKSVDVYVAGQRAPAATLTLTGTLTAPVSFDPPALDFGHVHPGQETVRTLTVRVSPRLFRPSQAPALVCSDPNVRVLPNAGKRSAAAAVPGVYHYTVALSARTPPRLLDAAISLAPGVAINSGVGVDAGARVRAATVPVQGEVVGALAAAPAALLFGAVHPGATRRVVLTGTAHLVGPGAMMSSSPALFVGVSPV